MKLNSTQLELPVQSVEKPILCSPYAEPGEHWIFDETGKSERMQGRRAAGYTYKETRTGTAQTQLFGTDEKRTDLPIVNALREDVRRWRNSGYENATNLTKELLRYWSNSERSRRLFFCQLEAVETIIYLTEIRGMNPDETRRKPRFMPKFTDADFAPLMDPPRKDPPNGSDIKPLIRYGCKMATGSGKTVVMSMLIVWALCNRGQVPADERFPRAILICAPNLTVKERLQVLRPERSNNYYDEFDIVPSKYRSLMSSGKVLIENWHQFALESEHTEGGATYKIVQKGEEGVESFTKRVLKELDGLGSLMVLNDEAHHAYRPKPLEEGATTGRGKNARPLTPEEKKLREEATVWIAGLDRFNHDIGIQCCVDLSATPFYLQGSGYSEGMPFAWLVSDFGLVDAIESGIVKIPRLPVKSDTGRPDPEYFQLWKHITDGLSAAQKIGRKPKPQVVWDRAQGALNMLAGQYKKQFEVYESASDAQEKIPPVLIIVCDNTNIAEFFYEQISGEREIEAGDEEPDDIEDENEEPDDEAKGATKTKKSKRRIQYGTGQPFPELFSNTPSRRNTVRIDSKELDKAESEESGNKKDAAQKLRELIATVGKKGEPGEQIRCVVSVSMLTEGWDANNVTHILGLRPFESQLLSEQVVGRGLRRRDYEVDPDTGLLAEEYVDVYGIPFSLIPYKGNDTKKPLPPTQLKNHVFAMPERATMEIRFPIVEGYAFALRKNLIKANVAQIEQLRITSTNQPMAMFVMPQVGYQQGLSLQGPGEAILQNRDEYYASIHMQWIEFEITRRIVATLTEGVGKKTSLRMMARHQLFPQVYRYVHQYIKTRLDFGVANHCELGLEMYLNVVVERLTDAIEPNDEAGELPLIPILNRYKPFGSTADVNFKTTKPVHSTLRSHLNQLVLDTASWENAAAFHLETSPLVTCYARNEQMGFHIPYEFEKVEHLYVPDYLVRMTNGRMVILEIKGLETEQDRAKHQATKRWCSAVNHADKMGKWNLHVSKDPFALAKELEYLDRQVW